MYTTGRGSILMRAPLTIQTSKKGDKQLIVVQPEIPYQVSKAKPIERIADLVREKTIRIDLRGTNRPGGHVHFVIELKRGEVAEVISNNLYKHTPTAHDGQHDDAEARLERRVLVQVVQDDLRRPIPLQLDHHRMPPVRFVPQVETPSSSSRTRSAIRSTRVALFTCRGSR